MSARNVIAFMRGPAARSDLLDSFKLMGKDEVMAVAADLGSAEGGEGNQQREHGVSTSGMRMAPARPR